MSFVSSIFFISLLICGRIYAADPLDEVSNDLFSFVKKGSDNGSILWMSREQTEYLYNLAINNLLMEEKVPSLKELPFAKQYSFKTRISMEELLVYAGILNKKEDIAPLLKAFKKICADRKTSRCKALDEIQRSPDYFVKILKKARDRKICLYKKHNRFLLVQRWSLDNADTMKQLLRDRNVDDRRGSPGLSVKVTIGRFDLIDKFDPIDKKGACSVMPLSKSILLWLLEFSAAFAGENKVSKFDCTGVKLDYE